MPFVLFEVWLPAIVLERVPDDARAARTSPCIYVDESCMDLCAVVRADLDERDIHLVGDFAIGSEVYVEGLPEETIDLDDDAGPCRIWWRGLLVGLMVPGGSA